MPLADEVPIRGVSKGPRSVDWRPLKPATLVWVEALDEGDPKKDVPFRDRLMTLSAPFSGEPTEILKIKHRYGGISWLQTPGLGFLSESQWMRRWRTTYLVDVDKPGGDPRKIFDLSSQDRYNDPGRPVTMSTAAGEYLIPVENGKIFLSGSGASPQGDRPFLDLYDLASGKSERLFHALKGHGATARLVFLPNESHGYRAKESVLHVLAEMIGWFDAYVKNRK